jgi:hypothetical protein
LPLRRSTSRVDRRNFHLFQPLTYQVATGALSPGEVAYPLRAIFRRHANVRVLMAEVTGFDLDRREVRLEALSAAKRAKTSSGGPAMTARHSGRSASVSGFVAADGDLDDLAQQVALVAGCGGLGRSGPCHSSDESRREDDHRQHP